MLQFDQVPAETADTFPTFGGGPSAGCTLGPSNQALGVIFNSFPDPTVTGSGLIDLQLYYRGNTAPHEHRPGPVILGVPPISQTFPGAVGFVARSHTPGVPAQIVAQVWETTDGSLPSAGVPNVNALTGTGGVTCLCNGGTSVEVTDGVTTVNPTSEIIVSFGLVLQQPSAGVAQINAAFSTGGEAGAYTPGGVDFDLSHFDFVTNWMIAYVCQGVGDSVVPSPAAQIPWVKGLGSSQFKVLLYDVSGTELTGVDTFNLHYVCGN